MTVPASPVSGGIYGEGTGKACSSLEHPWENLGGSKMEAPLRTSERSESSKSPMSDGAGKAGDVGKITSTRAHSWEKLG